MQQYNESPIFLRFILSQDPSGSLPIALYTAGAQDKKQAFVPLAYAIAAEEVSNGQDWITPPTSVWL